ncbi:MAG: hypothetical protein JNL70_13540 [Saprospiraceae bacterium]|nr:hypothetical protein [Saprospiraceae bacterium]
MPNLLLADKESFLSLNSFSCLQQIDFQLIKHEQELKTYTSLFFSLKDARSFFFIIQILRGYFLSP